MPPTDREQRILAAYAAGHTILQIAIKMGAFTTRFINRVVNAPLPLFKI